MGMLKTFFSIVIYLACSSVMQAQVNAQYIRSYLSSHDGLSNNVVTTIMQDKYGFMWFGTEGGLNRYDGYTFLHHKPTTTGVNSLHSPSVECILSNNEGNIYVGTKSDGIGIFDIKSEQFSQPGWKELEDKQVISFLNDFDGNIWIGTRGAGVYKYSNSQDSIINYCEGLRVNDMVQTADSTILVATSSGVFFGKDSLRNRIYFKKGYHEVTDILYDAKADSLWLVGWGLNLMSINYRKFKGKQYLLPNGGDGKQVNGYSLHQDSDGHIWIGTWGDGLYHFNKQTKQFSPVDIKPTSADVKSINFDVILEIYQDQTEDIWLGTSGGGVVKLSKKQSFNSLGVENESFGKKYVEAILIDSKNRTWIGCRGNGLLMSTDGKEYTNVSFTRDHEFYNKDGLGVKSIYEDEKGRIWVGVNDRLYIIDESDGIPVLVKAAKHFAYPKFNLAKLVFDLLYHKDELWVATFEQGILVYKEEFGVFKLKNVFKRNFSGLGTDKCNVFSLDSEEKLWVGTNNGVFKYNDADTSFIKLEALLLGDIKPIAKVINCLRFDDEDNLWFGTPCSLNKVSFNNEGQGYLQHFSVWDGLSNDYINSIEHDANGHIWVSTNSGISQFDIQNKLFRNYNLADGLGDDSYSASASFVSEDGLIYFGGYTDLTYFNPLKVKDNILRPNIVITDFKILNEKVRNESEQWGGNLNEQTSIVLDHTQTEFSFEFAALDYKSPGENQYAYQLEGFDKELNHLGNRRFISFNNLRAGDYKLHLFGSNSNGLWNEQAKIINIKVKPAPWKSWYAILIYIALIVLMVYILVKYSQKEQGMLNEINLQKVYMEQDRKLNDYKLKFFTNISHELRTPLTLILAPVNELLKNNLEDLPVERLAKKLKLVQSNTSRLYNLVNQLLEFRKADAGKIKLQASRQDMVGLLNTISEPFIELAEIKNIIFEQGIPDYEVKIYFDPERLEVVFNNLLSNAFKNVNEGGKVVLELVENAETLQVDITNTGAGIPQEKVKNVFKRFYQVEGSQAVIGSGIGLSLVKSYIDLHRGKVLVNSEPDKQTTFSVVLKKGKDHFNKEEIRQKVESVETAVVNSELVFNDYKLEKHTESDKTSKILLVEDNVDVLAYTSELLSQFYHVIEAENGREGLEKALDHKPDLIVADVMMPEMDGYEMCEHLKNKEDTTHIPVILLTAKGSSEDHLLGVKKGADLFLTKPFDPELLLEKVKQQINAKKKQEAYFSKNITFGDQKLAIDAEDELFLNKTVELIEQFVGDACLDQEFLASQQAMSLSTFYRRLKQVTGLAPGELMKQIKLKIAARYMLETNLSVSEVAETVGYTDLKNFRRLFKIEFDTTPLQYRMTNKQE
ncbi:hybrid sensor histidine kinase/response regulator transcription factor [Carboxylicivirga marina]|uniref:histidine kinase n=2 Tax=Carboxylicivirga TaxID=1628153 RepID=A0ABS1HQF4_9BACT|nr:hybrid sensor histidine kinase/response regulator transcription factor [Carboxylicivirga marina]MBK3519897.1 response regulator [Carboxylicivirga marina]